MLDDLARVGQEAGLDAVGVAPATPFTGTREHLERRKAEGLHGGMQFTYRNPARATDPAATLPGAAALVVGARAYRRADPPPPAEPSGLVARYARSDHYEVLRSGLTAMADRLQQEGWQTRVLVDDNALVDREAAYRAGLGWYGKNANVLLPGQGSWFVLGSVLTDAPLPPSRAPVPDGCGACTRCLDGCPTGAIVAPGVVVARRCLAWLVQARGPFPVEYRAALGDRLYGCDECQEVCPPNRRADRDPPAGDAGEAWVRLVDLLEADDAALLERHGRWYIPDRDPRYLRRNALVALGNTAARDDEGALRILERYRHGDDVLLAEHATWAADRIRERAGP